jgi:hypothetical protein
MSEKLEKSAQQYEQIAEELLKAAAHYKTASSHFRNKEIPRGAAHAYAGYGHINKAEDILKSESIVHAENSTP